MPFPVSISFPANPFPLRSPSSSSSAMANDPSLPQQFPRRNPTISSGVKRARPRGLWKVRGSGPRLTPSIAASVTAAPLTPAQTNVLQHRPLPQSESDPDSDRVSCPSSVLFNSHTKRHTSLDTPLSTDLDDPPHALPLVTKHLHQQHLPSQDYFSAIPPPDYNSSDDDDNNSTSWTTRTKIMDISTTAGPGEPPSEPTFTLTDWSDLQQLFAKAGEQYEFDDPAEILPLFRGVIHECHRCLLAYHDPSVLFITPPQPTTPEQSPTGFGPSRPIKPVVDLPTAFHSLLGTALFFFGNLMAANPDLALPGEPPSPVPYWIAALDVFESGENLPTRVEGHHTTNMPRQFNFSAGSSVPPPTEDWRMAIMWGRTLVAIATEIVDRNRGKPPPPPPPESFPSPFPTNKDYLKTGTIWDEEPEWPPESPFGVIINRRPPITRRMSLNYATPHEMLQLAMDHFSRGIFHLPHNTTTTSSSASASSPGYPSSSRQPTTTTALPFSRGKVLYEVAEEVLLLAEKLDDPEERREWARFADSIFGQIYVAMPYRYRDSFSSSAVLSSTTSLLSSRDTTSESRPLISEGMVAKARGRAWLVMGSTIAESIEEKMDRASETGDTIESLMQSEEAGDARDALTRAIELFERAKSFISAEASVEEEKFGAGVAATATTGEEALNEDNEDDVMLIDEDDDADDEQEGEESVGAFLSARARGKQRRDSRVEDARRTTAVSRLSSDVKRLRQQETEDERRQLSQLLAEALCSLANLTESKEHQEEFYRRAEAETGTKLFDDDDNDNDDGNDGMDEDR